MIGKKMSLPGVVFTDTSAPQALLYDKIESSGSLFLMDVGSPLGAFSGIPVNGGSVPNILAPIARGIIGAASSATLTGAVATTGNLAGQFLVERSAKGGVHGIISQTAQVASCNMIFSLPSEIRDYIYSKRVTNSFYISSWSKITRATLSSPAPQSHFDFAASTTNLLFITPAGPFNPEPGAIGLGRKISPAASDTAVSTPVDRFVSGGVHGVTGAGPNATDSVRFGLGTFGPWASFNTNKAPSRIEYRFYVEDLTVSGRTYAEVEALDFALFQEAFAVGGKFYGDTYTAPSDLP